MSLKEHPSYGNIEISRSSTGGGLNFYGTPLKPINHITVTIRGSKIDSKGNGDNTYYPIMGDIITRIRMTETQFAKMITTLNHGEGTPTTIEYKNNIEIEKCPKQENPLNTSKQHISDSYIDKDNNIDTYSKELQALAYKNISSTKGREEFNHILKNLVSNLKNTMEYHNTCLQETADKVIASVATEIEAMANSMIFNKGLKLIALENKENKNILE